jgi:hypothetical protein
LPWIPNPLGQPVKRGLWTWHSPPQMIFSSSIGLWSRSTIHPQSVYICQPFTKSTLPFAGLQHMQQCQVIKFVSMIWSKCMKNSLLSEGLNPGPLSHESSALPLDHGYSPKKLGFIRTMSIWTPAYNKQPYSHAFLVLSYFRIYFSCL